MWPFFRLHSNKNKSCINLIDAKKCHQISLQMVSEKSKVWRSPDKFSNFWQNLNLIPTLMCLFNLCSRVCWDIRTSSWLSPMMPFNNFKLEKFFLLHKFLSKLPWNIKVISKMILNVMANITFISYFDLSKENNFRTFIQRLSPQSIFSTPFRHSLRK